MFAETGLLFPYFQTFSQVQQLDEFCRSHKSSGSLANLVQTSTISEYDLGGEGDLFKAPEPIIEEPIVGIDPMTAAISMISCGEDAISPQSLKIADIESMGSAQLLSEVFYECKRDLLAKEETETPVSMVLNITTPIAKSDENLVTEEKLLPPGAFSKSVSSRYLSSMEWIPGDPIGPNFLDFHGMDFEIYGMRRAFSEGDIKNLANGSVSLGQPQLISSNETRKQKLSRYWNKKSKRNFGRKIKYACRKALADSQPRIRGRFAKTDESEIAKKQ
ncbi:hypothetical protein LguiA_031813 [Lonicera macranthoides]